VSRALALEPGFPLTAQPSDPSQATERRVGDEKRRKTVFVARLLQEALMGQKSEPAGFEQVYVLGIDQNGNRCGARFHVLKDSIVSAALDMNYPRF